MYQTMYTTEEYLLPRLNDSLSTWQPANKASVARLREMCFCETSIKENTCKFLFLLRNIFMLYLLLTSGAIIRDHRHTVILKAISCLWHLSVCSHCIDRQTDKSNWVENMKHHKVMATSLRQINYCHYGKNSRGKHTGPGRVNLGTFKEEFYWTATTQQAARLIRSMPCFEIRSSPTWTHG